MLLNAVIEVPEHLEGADMWCDDTGPGPLVATIVVAMPDCKEFPGLLS